MTNFNTRELVRASKRAVVPTTSEKIAKAACSYSRAFILEGLTQLVNNTYDKSKRLSLYKAVMDLRDLCSKYSMFSLEIDMAYQQFHRRIEMCKKFSLGNCYEMACMALDYVLRIAPKSTNAEVYQIKGGDHVFLVVGREKNSDPQKPETWGKDAYICDPWSDKVYPASQYSSQMKSYFMLRKPDGDYINNTEKFDKSRHKLVPVPFNNTQCLRKMHSRPNLDKIILLFKKRMKVILDSLEKLDEKLSAVISRLEKKYPNDSTKKDIIETMQGKFRSTINTIKVDINKNYTKLPYDILCSTLESSLNENLCSFQKAVKISNEDKKALAKKHNRFGLFKATTARKTSAALNEANVEINNIFKRH